ncbi:MAG: DUF2852 domain-containing protein [Hyphomicrobiales bacterium]|nr:DUF2852 domain-containing protein [Hyphomicrobiales bacterium]
MELVAKLDEYGKPAWIALMILGFIVFWPVGLALLVFLLWSGRMGCHTHRGPGRWHYEEKARDFKGSRWRDWGRRQPSSGNVAFDEYREATLKRLEQEHEEFMAFLGNLRQAKDKAEFDQFMTQRRRSGPKDAPDASEGPEGPAPQPQG